MKIISILNNDKLTDQAFNIALRVATYYGLFGIAWIIATDLLITNLSLSPGRMQQVQSIKGILFVLFSTLVVFLGVWREGKKAEEISRDLFREKQRLSSIIEGTNTGTWEWESGNIKINNHLAEILGYSLEELEPVTQQTFKDFIHPEDLNKRTDILERHLNGELDFYSDEVRLQQKEGGWVWGHIIGKVTNWSDDGNPLIMSGSVFNVTARKEALEGLQKSKKRFKELTELLPQPVWETDEDGNFTYINRAGLDIFGYSQYKLSEGANVRGVFAPEERERVSRNFQKVLDGIKIKNNEYLALTSDGTKLPVLVYSSPITRDGEIVGARGIILDISEQKQAQERLKKQKRERSILLRNLPGMAYKYISENDKEWTMMFVSEGCKVLTGYKPEELVNNSTVSYGDLIVEEDKRTVWREVQKYLDAERPFNMEYRIRTKGGELKWVWERGRGIFDEDGELENIQGIITDVTERKNIEFQLRKSEKKFRSYVENAPVGVYVVDEDGNYVDVNEAACEMTGYSKDELLDMSIPDLHPPEASEKVGLVDTYKEASLIGGEKVN